MRPLAHLMTISKHKWYVCKYCFRCGLYYQGIVHDLSKFSPIEFWVGAKYYQGTHSPNDEERRQKGYSAAWLHHKGRNKHHLEYWMDYAITPEGVRLTGMPIPKKYVVEMFCDRLAASKVYMGDKFLASSPYDYYSRGIDSTLLHPESRQLLETLLTILKDEGEDAVFHYIRTQVLN